MTSDGGPSGLKTARKEEASIGIAEAMSWLM